MKTLKDADIKNKTVLFRVDFNVTVEDGQVTEDFRMRAVLSTIQYLLENGAKKIVIISHFGRPNGTVLLRQRSIWRNSYLSPLILLPILQARVCAKRLKILSMR